MRECFLKKNRTHELSKRLLFTILIMVIYIIGRSLLLYGINPAAYQLEESLDAQSIVISMISGERYQYTLFALGIMPYMVTNLIVWVFMAVIRGTEFEARLSPGRAERFRLILMVVLAFAFAFSRAEGLMFKDSDLAIDTLRTIAVLEMAVGAVIIYGMANLNRDHGIGGQIPIILVNILDNLVSTIQKFTWKELYEPVILCLIMAAVILAMENFLVRFRVQRVSIHNEYADKSYIAFKVDPIGVMPVMFAASFLMILRVIVRFLGVMFKNSSRLKLMYEKLNLTDVTGVVVYLGIIFALNLIFSFIMLMPGGMAEQLQRGGDSIVGIYAGKKTKRFLRRKLLLLSIISGCILSSMMGISLNRALRGEISSELALFPATGMILAGMLCSLYREIKIHRKFDAYSFFI